jgi:hypothetical protein
MNPPAITFPPLQTADGGTWARITHASPFYSPLPASQGAPCSVPLTRDARSGGSVGLHCVPANRADCMRDGRRHSTPLARGLRRLPSIFHKTPHDFGAHNTNRHHASGGACGAAGRVLRKALPRFFPSSQVDDFTHRGGSFCSLTSIGEHNRRSFHGFGKIIHARAG